MVVKLPGRVSNGYIVIYLMEIKKYSFNLFILRINQRYWSPKQMYIIKDESIINKYWGTSSTSYNLLEYKHMLHVTSDRTAFCLPGESSASPLLPYCTSFTWSMTEVVLWKTILEWTPEEFFFFLNWRLCINK